MSEQINQNAWETQLRNELGTAPKADYQAWLGRYSGTLQQLTTTQVVLPASRRSIAAKAKWIVAAAALFAIGGWFWFDNSVNPPSLCGFHSGCRRSANDVLDHDGL